MPVVVITNPKDARYIIPSHEPIDRIRKSTFIRFLSFTASPAASINITIDNQLHLEEIEYIGIGNIQSTHSDDEYSPMYASRWNPLEYDDGAAHEIVVTVVDDQGRVGIRRHVFRVDGVREQLNIGPGEAILSLRLQYWVG
jgi:hypothetical protein